MSTLLRLLVCGLALLVVLWGSCVIALASLDTNGPTLLLVALVVLVAGLWGIVRLWRRTRPAGDR